MPYFADPMNRVKVTSPRSPSAPPGCRVIQTDIAAQLGLVDGQQLTADRATLLVEGKWQEYLASIPEDERSAPPQVVIEPRRGIVSLDNYGLLLSTTAFLPGYEITTLLGTVAGNTVRTRNVLTRFGANLSANFGGELDAYTKMLTDSRNEAVKRMVTDARTLGATGIVGISFNTSSLLEIATELLVVGTAVQARSVEDPGADR